MRNTTEIISNCNKEELMEIINVARNLNDYEQSTDSEILQALINGSIRIGEGYPGADGVLDHQLLHLRTFGSMPCEKMYRLPDVVSQIITKQQNKKVGVWTIQK